MSSEQLKVLVCSKKSTWHLPSLMSNDNLSSSFWAWFPLLSALHDSDACAEARDALGARWWWFYTSSAWTEMSPEAQDSRHPRFQEICLSIKIRNSEATLVTCRSMIFQRIFCCSSANWKCLLMRKMRRIRFSQHLAAVRGLFCSSNNTRD